MFFMIDMSDERVQYGAEFYQPLVDWLVANGADVEHIDPTHTLFTWDWPGGCREIRFNAYKVNERGNYYLCHDECSCGGAYHVAKREVIVPLTISAPESLRPVMFNVHEDAVAS